MRVYVNIVFRIGKDSFHLSNSHVVRTTICAPALLRGASDGMCALFSSCCKLLYTTLYTELDKHAEVFANYLLFL